MAMEEIEADFIAGTGRVLGVAVAIETIAPLIDTLEAEHIPVVSICPAALLAAGEITRQPESMANMEVLLLVLDGKIDLIGMENGQISGWIMPSRCILQISSASFTPSLCLPRLPMLIGGDLFNSL